MARDFDRESVIKSFRWLGHGTSYTEFNAFHPEYRPGRENRSYNRKHSLFPIVGYIRNEEQLLSLVEKLHGSHMLCYGMNPRLTVKRYRSGHPRAHRDSEIEVLQSFFWDFDLPPDADREALAMLELLLEDIMEEVEDRGFVRPVKAFTGNGFHLLFALPGIRVEECPDIKERMRLFKGEVLRGFGSKIEAQSAKVDSTVDLSRMAKIYGTAKPGRPTLSRFYGGERIEDERLREHLLGLDMKELECRGSMGLEDLTELPQSFSRLLEMNEKVRNLWNGESKETGDRSRSGYDYSLLGECLANGITDVRDLATILAQRPGGPVRQGDKGERYVKFTVSKVIKYFRWGNVRTEVGQGVDGEEQFQEGSVD